MNLPIALRFELFSQITDYQHDVKQRNFKDKHYTEWKPKLQYPIQGELNTTLQPNTRDEQPLGPKNVQKELTYHPTTPSFPRLYPTDDFSSKLEVTTPYKPGTCIKRRRN